MFGELKRRLYPNNRPNWLAKILNRFWAIVHASGFASADWVTLEVTGRKSGRPVSLPVVVAVVGGQRYLVSMLGEDAQWVRNVRAANGQAAILSAGRKDVRLVEVPASQRALILKVYLQHAPGARPHIPVSKDAPVADFVKIAADYPVFRIDPTA